MVSARSQLWLLSFTGFAINYMVRVNLNIAIVSMAKSSHTTVNQTEAFCTTHKNVERQRRSTSLNSLGWNEYEQGIVLGAFYWCHWTTQIAGGILSQRYGTRKVLGLSQFFTSALALVIPAAAKIGPYSLVALRVIQGIASGFVWPSMHTLVGRWVPPTERSKFVTAYLGSSVGAAVTFPLCALLMSSYGWQSVFLTTGSLGIVWCIVWWWKAYDSPNLHPTISVKERQFIEQSLGLSAIQTKKTVKVPWKAILSCRAVWIGVLARWGGDWGLFSLLAHAPTYLNHVHGLSIEMTGFVAGVPHLCRLLFALLISVIADKLLIKTVFNHTQVRKLATAVCCFGQGACMLGLSFTGCNSLTAVIFLTAATTLNGAISSGPLASFVDLSPNYAGTLLGLSGMISVLPGFLSPTLAGFITFQNQNPKEWSTVFLIDAIMLVLPGLIHIFFSTSEMQPWNSDTIFENNGPLQEPLTKTDWYHASLFT